MAKVGPFRQGTNSWKRDITLLTCILRLHCQPCVEYKDIAEFLLATWPDTIQSLAGRPFLGHPGGSKSIDQERAWVTGYISQLFQVAEENQSVLWSTARTWDTEVVPAILRTMGLDSNEYQIMDVEEMGLQIKWRREGDWKAGSVPLEPEPKPKTNAYVSI